MPLVTTALLFGATLTGVYLLRARRERRKDESLDENVDPETMTAASRSLPQEITLNETKEPEYDRILKTNTITIVHGSVTGTCSKLATRLEGTLRRNKSFQQATIQTGKVEEWDWWDELLNNEESATDATESSAPPIVVVILPTNTGGTWPVPGEALHTALEDLQNDWRIEKAPLRSSKLNVAVFGMGSSAYGDDTIGKPAKEAFSQLRSLGAKGVGAVGIGDNSVGSHADRSFRKWSRKVVQELEKMYEAANSSQGCECGQSESADGCCNSQEVVPEEQKEPEVLDIEDMGAAMVESKEGSADEVLEMVTPSQAAALKKEGYKLIGTHSAVKLCRWTKHQLRGRGGCYKHTFYGITSYQCMEATPSLACANKCTYAIWCEVAESIS